MQERLLFQGLLRAGGFFLLVSGIYRYTLWASNNLLYQGYQAYNLLQPAAVLVLGLIMLFASENITRFAYSNNQEQLSLGSLFRMGVKLLGLWLLYLQVNLLFSLADYWRMAIQIPEAVAPTGSGFWASQLMPIMAALLLAIVFIRYQVGALTGRD